MTKNLRILLGREDRVFLLGTKAYALVCVAGIWKAHDVSAQYGKYFRSARVSTLGESIVAGVIHQGEYFLAKDLPQYWRRSTREVCDEIDHACDETRNATKKVRKMLRPEQGS